MINEGEHGLRLERKLRVCDSLASGEWTDIVVNKVAYENHTTVLRQPCYCGSGVEHIRLILQLFFVTNYTKIVLKVKLVSNSSFGEDRDRFELITPPR